MRIIYKKFVFLFFSAFLVSPLFAQDSSLVGFWTFDDSTAVDSSIYSNNGSLNGNPIIIGGIKGNAIYFDDVDDEVFVGDSNCLDTDSLMTISLWIKPDSVVPGGSKVMSKWYSAPQEGDWLLSLSSQDSCNGNCVSYYFVFANYGVYGTNDGWFSIAPHNIDYYLILGEWNFLTVTFDTGFVNLYYNGSLVYTDTSIIKYTSLHEYGTDDIHIGRYWSGNSNYSFKGGLDEIRIYNRPLSAGEIYNLYNQVTAIENEENNNAPLKFDLFQNYPNPFNPHTTIKFQIPELSQVTLKIYDVLGNELETLIKEEKPAGIYKITWDAADSPGGVSAKSGYASGVYFYQLRATPFGGQAGDFIQTKKMILLK